MTNARWSIAAVLIGLSLLTGINVAIAQVAVKADDLIGTWELVSAKDVKTGAAVYGIEDASTGINWFQYTRSHYMIVAMERGRSVMNPADFAKLSPEEKLKTNYARIWNEKNEQIFAAGAGTYNVEGDKIRLKWTMALNSYFIGVDDTLKIIRLDKSTMIVQRGFPILNPTTTRELTYRRIE